MSKRKTKQYTLEFKKSSAKLASTADQPVSQTAKNLGVNVNTLHGWVSKFYIHTATNKNHASNDDVQAELKRLRKENARLKQERDILKKASAYFASEIL